jgi:hypothetical protein
MQIKRTIASSIQKHLFGGKAIIVYGPRRVGKTTLVHTLLDNAKEPVTYLNADEPHVVAGLTHRSSGELRTLIGPNNIVIIDEAQRIENIGITIKLLVDTYPDLQIIATGSSSFDLANKIKEPLTGRSIEYSLFPLSLEEISYGVREIQGVSPFEPYLLYGTYPESITQNNPKEIIADIARNYLYKDVLLFQAIRKSELLEKLLTALALQIGSEVSYTELSRTLEVDKITVERYISLLEAAFVIFHLRPYARNMRQTLNRKRKIYFWDLGIRNAIIGNFNPLSMRGDIGALWENFSIAQMIIADKNHQKNAQYFFWRSYRGAEIDLVRQYDGALQTFECKWGKKPAKIPTEWKREHPKVSHTMLSPDTLVRHTMPSGK